MALHFPKLIYVNSIEEWEVVVQEIISLKPLVILLNGQLGAGKTTMVKYLVSALAYTDEVTSPTFSIVNEYQANDKTIYHMDLYRLESYEDLFHAGIEEYFYSNSLCIVEWPSLLLQSDLLTEALVITIEVNEEQRIVTIDNAFERR